VKAMATVSSNCLVSILDAFEDQFYMYIAMEYCAKGNMRGFLLSLDMEGKFISEEV
jgi:serine/threonine protein kinase